MVAAVGRLDVDEVGALALQRLPVDVALPARHVDAVHGIILRRGFSEIDRLGVAETVPVEPARPHDLTAAGLSGTASAISSAASTALASCGPTKALGTTGGMPASARAATSSLMVTISVGAANAFGDLDVRPRNGAGGFLGGRQPVEAERVDAVTAGRAAGKADSGQSQACQEKKRTHVAPYAIQTDRRQAGRCRPKRESLTGKYQQS